MDAVLWNPNYLFSRVPSEYPPPIIPSQKFPTYLENPDVSPSIRIICEILTRVPPEPLETALSSTRIEPVPEIVEEVLKLSYGSPHSALKFFHWAGSTHKSSLCAWNLLVDLLGRNGRFEQMWEAIRSMKKEGLLRVNSFILVFGSYCSKGRFNEAVMAFDAMERYGIEPDVVAMNSLLSAICREASQTSRALEVFQRIKGKITPDSDSYAILLEGWEKDMFGETSIGVGWSSENLSVYYGFLTSLICGSFADEAIKFLEITKGKECFPGLKFYSNALDIMIKRNDSSRAVLLWDLMVGSRLVPNLIMYNAIISLVCNNKDIDNAFRFLDEMVLCGVFPDSLTYNVIFRCLIKNKKAREVGRFFFEMIKNEWSPIHSNCAMAITMFFEEFDPLMAIEIWDYMINNRVLPLEESGNALLIGLCNMDRMTELGSLRRICLIEESKYLNQQWLI